MAGSNKLVDQSEALDSFFESLMEDVEAYAENEEQELNATAHEETPAEPDPNAFRKKGKRIFDEASPASESKLPETNVVEAKTAEPEPVKPVLDTPVPDNKLFEVLPSVKPVEPVVKEENLIETKVEAEPEVVVVEEKKVEQVVETPAEVKQETPEPPIAAVTGRPEWGEADFQAMLFKVAGLTLAVPLVDLNGVVECDLEDVTAMPGSADFYLGLLSHLGKSVPLVDTARFVLPPNKLHVLAGDDPKDRITRAVMIQDCQYALGCDEVNEVLTLKPDEVRWRTQRTSRRWLAGTVVEHMCALIDATAFAELLAERASIQAFRE